MEASSRHQLAPSRRTGLPPRAVVLRNLRVRYRVAHPFSQALRFGEGAQNDDVLVVVVNHAVQRSFFTVRHGGGGVELEVRLVNHHGMKGTFARNARIWLSVTAGPVVAGGADQIRHR